jgi:hypothetical protein
VVYPVDGGAQITICAGCATAGGQERGVTRAASQLDARRKVPQSRSPERRKYSYAIPLQPGQVLPKLPASWIQSPEDAAALPGARLISDEAVFAGADPSMRFAGSPRNVTSTEFRCRKRAAARTANGACASILRRDLDGSWRIVDVLRRLPARHGPPVARSGSA